MVERDASRGAPGVEPPERPWSLSLREVLEALGADPERGLDAEEVRRRRKRFGPNRLRRAEAKSAWVILAYQLRSLMVYLLAAAMGVSFLFGQWVEGLAIAAVILLNAAIGFVTELRAVRSMEALYRLGRVEARVLREGSAREVAAEQLVPGDVVLLEGGDIATADVRLVEASKLQVDESALTGESLPVGKSVEPLEEDAPLHDRRNMVFKGTAVSRGSGLAVVVATGMETELGRIASLVEEGEEETTPLEKRLDALSRRLIWVTLALAALIGSTGILAGRELFLMIETSIALAVAAVPEGLPIVATIALARGMWRMAERNALVSRLSAVETLGATTVILTDKTGTLTENLMTVVRVLVESSEFEVTGLGLKRQGGFLREGEPVGPNEDPLLVEALEAGALCNNASFQDGADGGDKPLGDPLEVALLVAAAKAGLSRGELTDKMPEVREEAFDPETKLMATFHRDGAGRFRVAVKGAPEAVLAASGRLMTPEGGRALSEEDRRGWLEANQRMAEEGLRVVAVATKEVEDPEAEPYRDLAFVGLVGMLDPPRADVRRALERCRQAGLRVVMVTGDQAATARKVAGAVGLVDEGGEPEVVGSRDLGSIEEMPEAERQRLLRAPIFARVTPEQKLHLVGLHQGGGEVVAMTGDGVNDAPALKKADIGVAMGRRGTQVAREAADMILKDDAFSTIVTAVEGGRVIFDNIRKFVLYLLSCNVSEIMAVALASALGAPLPVLPLQILFLNLVTDVFPALALGLGEGDPAVMERPPRDPAEPILTTRHWAAVGGYGALITAAVLGALALALLWLEMEKGQAVTVSFLTLAFAQLWHVFNMRERGSKFLRNEITRNVFVWGALGLCGVLLLAAVYVPVLAVVLKVEDPGARGWALVLAMSLLPWVAGQGLKLASSRS